MVDLEGEKYQGIEEFDIEEINPISQLPVYIPPLKGKTKVTKDPDSENFMVSTPLFPEQVEFEGPPLSCIPILKMEDWDSANMLC